MSIEELRIDRDRPRSGNAGRAVGAVLILLALAGVVLALVLAAPADDAKQ